MEIWICLSPLLFLPPLVLLLLGENISPLETDALDTAAGMAGKVSGD
jgi:hypothetical protein